MSMYPQTGLQDERPLAVSEFARSFEAVDTGLSHVGPAGF